MLDTILGQAPRHARPPDACPLSPPVLRGPRVANGAGVVLVLFVDSFV